ncbi:Interleukin-1 receptor-associated kinase 1 [Myotis brandtii]|uniref:Interleukin-1 receptor-associated kinase 1 n=1 Tax=Myotis brandtii TaxID=109478 RepID=S7MRZ0_MYOBR|nr:Interleukin-1 receptor-associated kinase 1 [Myotis brandtii]
MAPAAEEPSGPQSSAWAWLGPLLPLQPGQSLALYAVANPGQSSTVARTRPERHPGLPARGARHDRRLALDTDTFSFGMVVLETLAGHSALRTHGAKAKYLKDLVTEDGEDDLHEAPGPQARALPTELGLALGQLVLCCLHRQAEETPDPGGREAGEASGRSGRAIPGGRGFWPQAPAPQENSYMSTSNASPWQPLAMPSEASAPATEQLQKGPTQSVESDKSVSGVSATLDSWHLTVYCPQAQPCQTALHRGLSHGPLHPPGRLAVLKGVPPESYGGAAQSPSPQPWKDHTWAVVRHHGHHRWSSTQPDRRQCRSWSCTKTGS